MEPSTIFVSKERLEALEVIEQNIPALIEKGIFDYKKARLKILHDKDKQNPAGVNARVKRYNERNKEKIKANRLIKRNQNVIVIPFLPPAQPEGDEFVVTF
jgi:hypothetical protein